MPQWLKNIFSAGARAFPWLRQYFQTDQAAQDTVKALAYVGQALPYVRIAGDIITGALIPGTADDLVWAAIKAKFPTLFDGRPHTADEMKLAGLAYATEAMRAKFPFLETSVIRKAVEMAVGDYKAEQAPAK